MIVPKTQHHNLPQNPTLFTSNLNYIPFRQRDCLPQKSNHYSTNYFPFRQPLYQQHSANKKNNLNSKSKEKIITFFQHQQIQLETNLFHDAHQIENVTQIQQKNKIQSLITEINSQIKRYNNSMNQPKEEIQQDQKIMQTTYQSGKKDQTRQKQKLNNDSQQKNDEKQRKNVIRKLYFEEKQGQNALQQLNHNKFDKQKCNKTQYYNDELISQKTTLLRTQLYFNEDNDNQQQTKQDKSIPLSPIEQQSSIHQQMQQQKVKQNIQTQINTQKQKLQIQQVNKKNMKNINKIFKTRLNTVHHPKINNIVKQSNSNKLLMRFKKKIQQIK